MDLRRLLSLLSAALLLLQPTAILAQEHRRTTFDYSQGPDAWPNIANVFKSPDVPVLDLANSGRLDELIREGKLFLSLSDTIALAIENNLDLAWARYGPLVAGTDLLRAKSGQQLRGIQTQISTLSTGLSVGAGGGARGTNATGITQRAAATVGGGGAGDASSFFGTQAVNLDPVMFAGIDWGHFSNPQTSNFVTGTNTFITERSNSNIGARMGFKSGATASLVWANTRSDTNSLRANFNPALRSNVTLRFTQPLIRGFGYAVNTRNITVAKRNREVSDLAFKGQAITVVVRMQQLYWDLVSLRANADASREALGLAQKLYQDNKRRVEIGTLAPIEIVRAEAEVAARQEDLTIAETQMLLQETLIKGAISVNGIASPSLQQVRIIPTDRIEVPPREDLGSIDLLMATALAARPDIEQSRIQLGNRDINLKAIRNGRLPRLDLSIDVTNNGLAGQLNDDFLLQAGQSAVLSDFFLGGLGTTVGQLFRRNFPDYQVALSMTIPLRNRQAQADLTATMLEGRQAEIRLRQTENAIRTEVQNAVIQVEQARARYQTALKSRILQERTLEAEQKKFDLGVSTIFLVVQAQRDVAVARSQEIAAMNNYALAGVEMDRATGHTLTANGISIAEAYEGVVRRRPDPLPVAQPITRPVGVN